MSFPNLFFLVVITLAVAVMGAIAWQEHLKTRDMSKYIRRLHETPASAVNVWIEYRTYYDAIAGVVAESEAWLFAQINGENRVCLATEDVVVKDLVASFAKAGIVVTDKGKKQADAVQQA